MHGNTNISPLFSKAIGDNFPFGAIHQAVNLEFHFHHWSVKPEISFCLTDSRERNRLIEK